MIAKDLFTREVEVTAVSNRCNCYKEEKCDVTLLPHRSKISGSQHPFLTERAIFIVERWENASATVLFLSAIMLSHTCQFSRFFLHCLRDHDRLRSQVAQAHYASPEQHYPTKLINYSYSKKIIRRCMEKYSLLTKLAKCTLNIALKFTFSVFLFFFVF